MFRSGKIFSACGSGSLKFRDGLSTSFTDSKIKNQKRVPSSEVPSDRKPDCQKKHTSDRSPFCANARRTVFMHSAAERIPSEENKNSIKNAGDRGQKTNQLKCAQGIFSSWKSLDLQALEIHRTVPAPNKFQFKKFFEKFPNKKMRRSPFFRERRDSKFTQNTHSGSFS